MIISMTRRIRLVLCAVAICLGSSMPVNAHHGTGINYDSSVQITVEATVTRFRYAQPHLQIWLDVKDEEGNVVNWACEYVPNIPFLIREGYSRKLMQSQLPVGTELTVTLSPARSGKAVGLVYKMVNSAGEIIGPDLSEMIMQGSRK